MAASFATQIEVSRQVDVNSEGGIQTTTDLDLGVVELHFFEIKGVDGGAIGVTNIQPGPLFAEGWNICERQQEWQAPTIRTAADRNCR